MFEKERIAIDITSEKISILVGTRYKIAYATTIDTPRDSYVKDEIVDVQAIKEVIDGHLGKARFRTKSKDLYFVVRGDDLIIRHITLPQMKDAAIKDSVEWELTQFVGERTDEYFVSYEVLSGRGKDQNDNLDILMVATEKAKINKYLQLGKDLGLQVVGMDVVSNISARVLRAYQGIFGKATKSVGLIDINCNASSLTIVERGKVQMEKYLSYGLSAASNREILNNNDYEQFLSRLDLNAEEDFTDGKLQFYFDNVCSQFNGIIQFYSSGKVKKTLDKIFISGSLNKIENIDKYFQETFNTHIENILNFDSLKFNVKVSNNISLNEYFYNYGLLIRTEKNELNLVPAGFDNQQSTAKKQKSALILGIALIVLLVGGFGAVKGKEIYLKHQEKALQEELAKSKELLERKVKLEKEISLINQHIQIAEKLETIKTVGTDTMIRELSKLFPSGTKVTTIAYTKDTIAISGTAGSQSMVEELWANLREVDGFKNSYVNTISNTNQGITFNLVINLKGGNVNE